MNRRGFFAKFAIGVAALRSAIKTPVALFARSARLTDVRTTYLRAKSGNVIVIPRGTWAEAPFPIRGGAGCFHGNTFK